MSAEAQATEAIPVHQMPLVRTELREIHRALTPEERVDKDHDMHRLKREILEEEESLKSYTKERKGAIAKLETERDALIEVGEKGRSEWVDVEIRLDVEAGRRIVVQKETGELLGDEPMQYADRQPNLFPATLENDAPAVPVSRQVRAAFLSTLGDQPGGGAVLKLHDDGLLDPTDWEIEEATADMSEFADDGDFGPRDQIAESESELDEVEKQLADHIGAEDLAETLIVEIAVNSRVKETDLRVIDASPLGTFASLLRSVRFARSTIEAGHSLLTKTPAESVEHDDRSEQLASTPDPEPVAGDVVEIEESNAVEMRNGRWEPVAIAETTEASVRVPVRELRTVAPEDRVGRWAVDEYWTAHDAGMLDPSEDDLRSARVVTVEIEPDVEQLNEDLDALEQDCASEIKTSAKARMAITRGTWPTKVAKVDDAIQQVRFMRARLSVALDLEAEASASS